MRKIKFQFSIVFILISLFANSQIKLFPTPVTGTAHTRYHGIRDIQTFRIGEDLYLLSDYTRGSGIETYIPISNNYETSFEVFQDYNNIWDEYANSAKDNAALDAHWALGEVYDYFFEVHGRKGYDNANSLIKCYVHFNDYGGMSAWSNGIMCIGDGTYKYKIMATLEVIAHEFSHGIVNHTCNLDGVGESGAIDESLSDIWAAVIEQYVLPDKNEWLHGEDIAKNDSAYRSMSNPKLYKQPDTYGKGYWIDPNSGEDDGDKHTNSGVMNYWFYLLAVGDGTLKTNDNGACYSVFGIGMEKAAKIVYDMQTKRLKSDSKFIDARIESINAAIYLYGANSNEVVQVTNAWHAVGVGVRYIYPISGPSIVCNQTSSTFTINYLPPGCTINWTKSNNLTYISGQGTKSYTVKAASYSTASSGSVNAVIIFLNCDTLQVSKTFWVGKPAQPTINPSGYPTIELNISQYITIRATSTPGYPTSFNWWVTGNPCGVDIFPSSNGKSCTFEAIEPSWNNFYFNTTNVCGTSSNAGGVIEVIEGGGGGMLSVLKVYPNPASSYITVSISDSIYNSQVSTEYELEVIDNFSNILIKEKGIEKEKQVNVSRLKVGFYTIRLKYNGKIYLEKFLIL